MAAPPSRTSRSSAARPASAYGFAIEFRLLQPRGRAGRLDPGGGAKKAAGIIINGAGFTTTSVAIHDAIKAVRVPVIEVHVTNIFAREAWRHAFL